MQKRKEIAGEPRLIDTNTLCMYLSLGRNTAVEYAKSIGADRRVGKRLLYDKTVIDNALKSSTTALLVGKKEETPRHESKKKEPPKQGTKDFDVSTLDKVMHEAALHFDKPPRYVVSNIIGSMTTKNGFEALALQNEMNQKVTEERFETCYHTLKELREMREVIDSMPRIIRKFVDLVESWEVGDRLSAVEERLSKLEEVWK